MLGDHVYILISISPKYAVSQVVDYVKRKSAIHIARNYGDRERNFTGEHFWARGYYVNTVGLDEARVRKYIKDQDTNEAASDHWESDPDGSPF